MRIPKTASLALALAMLGPTTLAQRGASRAVPCEVVILGVDHTYYGEGYRPAHLRAFFKAVKPTAMGIENPAGFQAVGQLRVPLFEAKEVMAYATAQALPVYGVDWDSPTVPQPPTPAGWSKAVQSFMAQFPVKGTSPVTARAAGLSQADARTLSLRRALEAAVVTYRVFGGASRAMELLNSAAFLQYMGDENAAAALGRADDGQDPYRAWRPINAVIAENIRAVASKHPGGRLLVVYGGLHKPLLDAALAHAPEVRLRQPAEWFPLDVRTLSQYDTADDVELLFSFATEEVAMLSYPGVVHRTWLRTQAAALEAQAKIDIEARYYLARWLTVEGQWESAARLLQEVADGAKDRTLTQDPRRADSLSFWPPDLNLRRRALFALALIHDLAGRRDSAVTIYAGLRDELATETAALGERGKDSWLPANRFAKWVQMFLTEPYINHPDQYLRGLAAQ
jgi:hypothetical protein